MQTIKLVEQLNYQTNQIINRLIILKEYDLKELSWKENNNTWSILECLEHLNLYGDFYLPEIEHKIDSSISKTEVEFKNGFLGRYFSKSMLPKEKIKKMKTFKDKNPINLILDKNTIEKLIIQQFKLLELIEKSKKVSMNEVKIKTSFSNLIKMKLGDTFQFLINHIKRHLIQIEKIEKLLESKN